MNMKSSGWHPLCRCHVITILKTDEEIAEDTRRILAGEPLDGRSVNRVDDVPQEFTDWVRGNSERIEHAKSLSYFVKDNKDVVEEILNPKQKVLTTLEKAKLRHDARTPEQIEAIKNRWAERQHKHELIKKTAGNVLKVASDYGEVDYSKLQQFISAGNLTAMQTEARIVAKQVSAFKKQEMALSDLIPDAHGWHKQFSMAELQTVHDAVKAKLDSWSSLTLEQQAKKLNFEIAYVADPAKYKTGAVQYSTWKVSQSAYTKQLDAVNYQIAYNEQTKILEAVDKWSQAHPKRLKVKSLFADAESTLIAKGNMPIIKAKVAAAKAEMDKRIAEQARRDAKKTAISFGDECFTKERKDNAKYFLRENEANDYFHNNAVETWAKATKTERDAVHRYTVGSAYMTEPLRAVPNYYHYYTSRISQFKSDCKAMTDYISRSSFKHDVWIKRDDNSGIVGHAFGLDLDSYKNHPQDLVGMVGTDKSFLSCGSNRATRFEGTNVRKDVIYNLYCPKGTKATYAEPFNNYGQFGRNWDGQSKCSYLNENEILLQRGTTMRITKAEYDSIKDKWYIDVDVIAQEAKEIEDIIVTPNGFYAKLK